MPGIGEIELKTTSGERPGTSFREVLQKLRRALHQSGFFLITRRLTSGFVGDAPLGLGVVSDR